MSSIAVIYSAVAGVGGLGLQAVTAIAALAAVSPVTALGPGHCTVWPLDTPSPDNISWNDLPAPPQTLLDREILRRFRVGKLIFGYDRDAGQLAAKCLLSTDFRLIYAFTQVALESFEWAATHGCPMILDNPNGHIRGFAQVYRTEFEKWIGGRYHGHPTASMIDRVEREYKMADHIRVSSAWAKASMVKRGIPAEKVGVCPQPINRVHYSPSTSKRALKGRLRICFVGSLDLRKGFVYLLRAMRAVGTRHVSAEFVGATGDRGSKWLLARESKGLSVASAPGDPVPAYHRADLFVLPSLEDGFGFVAAEAMACGIPVVVTDQCGVAEWVQPGRSGWIIPAADSEALSTVLEAALHERSRLVEMGREARRGMENRNPADALRQLAEFVVR